MTARAARGAGLDTALRKSALRRARCRQIVAPPRGRRRARVRCPVLGCQAVIISTLLMCPDHWRSLRPATRRAHNAAFRHMRTELRGPMAKPAVAAMWETSVDCILEADAQTDGTQD